MAESVFQHSSIPAFQHSSTPACIRGRAITNTAEVPPPRICTRQTRQRVQDPVSGTLSAPDLAVSRDPPSPRGSSLNLRIYFVLSRLSFRFNVRSQARVGVGVEVVEVSCVAWSRTCRSSLFVAPQRRIRYCTCRLHQKLVRPFNTKQHQTLRLHGARMAASMFADSQLRPAAISFLYSYVLLLLYLSKFSQMVVDHNGPRPLESGK